MNIREKMVNAFPTLQGGLFSKVTKADVGDGFASLSDKGVTLMGWADPFFPDPSIPPHVAKAVTEAITGGKSSHYTLPIGNLELRKEIAVKLKKQNNIEADPARNILITPGSDSGLFYSMLPFIGPGDEVMVPDPSYPSNFLNPKLFGGITVPVPLRADMKYQIDISEFKKRLTKRTKMVLLTHPNNPTTTVFSGSSLNELANFIIDNDLILVADQAFEDIIFDNAEFISPCAIPGMWERTLSVFSISKGMGLSGFRVGYIVADDIIMDVLYGGAVNVLGATNTAAQLGAIAAFRDSSFISFYHKIYDKRRKNAYDILSKVDGVRMLMPESGFYSWIDVSAIGDSDQICNYLIEEANVAVNDGAAYGEQGKGYLRIIHGALDDDYKAMKALERIASALLFYEKDREKLQ